MKTYVIYGSALVVPSFYIKAENEEEAIKKADKEFYDVMRKNNWIAHDKRINNIVDITTYGDYNEEDNVCNSN